MEQLINAATMPYWATIILSFLGGAFIGVAILIFVVEHGNIKKEENIMGYLLFIVGAILVILGKLGVIPNIEYSNMVGQSVSTLEAVYTIAVFIQIIGIILIIIKIKE